MRLLGAVYPPILVSAARRALASHCRPLGAVAAATATLGARATLLTSTGVQSTPFGVGHAIATGRTVFGGQIRRVTTAQFPDTITASADDAVTSAAVLKSASIPGMKLKTEAQARRRQRAGLSSRPNPVSAGVVTRARQHSQRLGLGSSSNQKGLLTETSAASFRGLRTAGAVLAGVPTTPDKKSKSAGAGAPSDGRIGPGGRSSSNDDSSRSRGRFYLESTARYHSHKPPSPARPSPEITSGEDAFCNVETDRYHVLGVADGVGGWAEHGVDPSLFAWELMNNCTAIATTDPTVLDSGPTALLTAAFERVQREKKVTAGSSTASVAVLNKQTGLMRGANLGDSAIAVIRQGSFVLKTRDQQHYFNAPYQLAVIPDGTSSTVTDTPDMAAAYETATFLGDLIVLATDGYTDNVFSRSTLSMCTHRDEIDGPSDRDRSTPAQVGMLGDRLLEAALSRSLSSHAETPFSHHAEQAGFQYRGGKKDDITLLIAKVCEADEPVSDSYPGGAPPPPHLPHGGSLTTLDQASAQQWSGFSLASSL